MGAQVIIDWRKDIKKLKNRLGLPMTFYLDDLVFTTWKKWDYFCEEWCCCCRFRQTALVTPKRLLVLLEEVRKEVVSFSTNCGSLKKRHLLANTEIKQNNNSSFSENKSFQLFFGYTWNDATMTLLGGGLSRFGKSLYSLEIIFRIVGKIMNVFGEFWRF